MFDVSYAHDHSEPAPGYLNTSSSSSPKLDTSENPKNARIIKRKRLTLVCDSCKKKKVKCDKQAPCTSCVKAGVASTCNYSSVYDGKDRKIPAYVSSASKPIVLENGGPERKVNKVNPPIEMKYVAVEPNISAPKIEYTTRLANRYGPNGTLTGTIVPFTPGASNKSPTNIHSHNNSSPAAFNLPHASSLPMPSNTPYKNGSISSSGGLSIPLYSPNTGLTSNSVTRSSSISGKSFVPPPSIPSTGSYQPSPPTPRLASSVSTTMATLFSPAYDTPITLPSLKWKPIRPAVEFVDEVQSMSDPNVLESRSVVNSVVGINPVFYSTENINFFAHSDNPFSWLAIMKSDKALRSFWSFICIQKNLKLDETTSLPENKPVRLDITKLATIRYNSEETPAQKVNTCYQNILKRSIEKTKTPSKPLLIERIHNVLPNRKNVWKLIDRYFKYLYSFMPIIDEGVFIADLERILGKKDFEDESKFTHLNVTYKTDFITIGTMLFMMRQSYLSLFTNNDEKNVKGLNSDAPCKIVQNLRYLLRNPINIDVVEIANECCEMFFRTETLSLSLIQLLFFSKIYRRQAPEDSHSADETNEFVDGEVLRVAYGLKLNRDPELMDPSESPPIKNIKRKIWHFIVLADMYHSYTFGNPSNLDDLYYDTQLPETDLTNSNLLNKELDVDITKIFYKPWKFSDSLRNLLVAVLDRKQRYQSAQVAERLNEFEVLFFQNNGAIADIVKREFIHETDVEGDAIEEMYGFYLFKRHFHLKFFVSTSSFLISIYQHMYSFYAAHQKSNLAYFYLKKIFIFISETIPFYYRLLEVSDTQCDCIYNPALQSLIHKSNQLNLAFLIRLTFVLFDNDKRPNIGARRHNEYYQLVASLKKTLTKYSEVMIRSISKLSNRYYYSWKITKGHNFFHAIATNEQFYQFVYERHPEEYQAIIDSTQFGYHQMQELYELCHGCLRRTITCDDPEDPEPLPSAAQCAATSSPRAPQSEESLNDPVSLDFQDIDIDQQWLDLVFDSEQSAKDVSFFELFNDFQQVQS